jgi:hypothetical protein
VAPVEMRELRRMLRYRNLMVAQAVRIKNKMSVLLMEVDAEYNKQQLHGKKYFTELLGSLEEGPESVKELLRLSRGALEMFETTQQQILDKLRKEPRLMQRLEVLKSIRGVGDVTALSWALEICDPHRFASIANAVSYCGLSSALVSSADKQRRGPISKQRNAHLQTVLIEAAKLAPRWKSAVGGPARAGDGPRAPQSGHAVSGSQTGGVSAGGGRERETVSDSNSGGDGKGGANRAVRVCQGTFTVRPPFPRCQLWEAAGGCQGFASPRQTAARPGQPPPAPNNTY